MSTPSHKILSQVVQLSYDDAGAAYRLQDRVSNMQRNQLEGIIERVLDEFDVVGEIVRIPSLQLDLGNMEDADFEVLFPILFEQALRDELGQLMYRREFDPLIEVETVSYSKGALQDWLYYLEHGIRRWHDNADSKEMSLTEVFKTLSTAEATQLRLHLIELMRKSAVTERLLGALDTEEIPDLVKLLFGEGHDEMLAWIADMEQQAVRQLSHQKSSLALKHTITKILIKHWNIISFQWSSKELAKVKTLDAVEASLKITIQTPLPEIEQKAAERGSWRPSKVLQYLLFYGYWPASAAKPEGLVDLGEYILQLLETQRIGTVSVLRETIAYATARKRLVYQLKQEQLARVVELAFPQMHQALLTFDSWLETQPTQIKIQLQTPKNLQTQWLELFERKANTSTNLTVQLHQEALASWVAGTLPESIAKQMAAQAGLSTAGAQSEAIRIFSTQVLQALKEKPTTSNRQATREVAADNAFEQKEVVDSDSKDTDQPKAKPFVPKSLLQDIPEEYRQNQPKENTPQKDNAVNELEEEAEPITRRPQNELEAMLYFLRLGVWPETLANTNAAPEGALDSNIIIPEAVLSQLLKEKPIELLAGIFPLLVSARVRERLVYQVGDSVFQEMIAAFASIHPPVARFQSYYAQLQPLAASWATLLQSEAVAALPAAAALANVSTNLKTFLLTLLYEEPSVRDVQAFISRFLEYWQQSSGLSSESFNEVLAAIAASKVLPTQLTNLLTASINIRSSESTLTTTSTTDAEQMEGDLLIAALLDEGVDIDTTDISSEAFDSTNESVGNNDVTLAESINKLESQLQDLPSISENSDVTKSEETDLGVHSGIHDKNAPIPDAGAAAQESELGNEEATVDTKDGVGTSKSFPESTDTDTNEYADVNAENLSTTTTNQTTETIGDTSDTTKIPIDQTETAAPQEPINETNTEDADTAFTPQPKPEISATVEDRNTATPNLLEEGISSTQQELPGEDIDAATEEYALSPAATMPFHDSQTMMEQEEAIEAKQEAEQKTLRQKIEKITRAQLPESVKQKKLVRPQDPFTQEEPKAPLDEPVFIENAGLVLLWPFIGHCFGALGYTEKGLFKDIEKANRAVHLLQYMATGEEQAPEHQLVLNKILCGIPVFEAVQRDVILTAQEREEAEAMLRATVQNWEKMKKLSVHFFSDSFLKRRGRLTEDATSWTLRVDQESFDMLLDTLPWTIGMIKLKYMEKVLYVEWR